MQDLIWDERATLASLILDKRAYIYICGDAKSMAKSVEDKLMRMLAEARNGTPEVEGAKELKLLKDRNVSIYTSLPHSGSRGASGRRRISELIISVCCRMSGASRLYGYSPAALSLSIVHCVRRLA